jgi:hypothetical protein
MGESVSDADSLGSGGRGEIRTHGGLAPSTVFKTDFYNKCQKMAIKYNNKINDLY